MPKQRLKYIGNEAAWILGYAAALKEKGKVEKEGDYVTKQDPIILVS